MELPGLDFSPGLATQHQLWSSLGLPINCPGFSSRSFFLVVSFGRCSFRLSLASVGLILQASIDGSSADFRVVALGDRVFRFSVSSNLIGHAIYKLRSFECCHYKLYLHL